MRLDRIDMLESMRLNRITVLVALPAPHILFTGSTTKETSMRIFVTGASGWIGSAVVPELIGAGHQVLGLARSDSSTAAVAALGAEVLRGDLEALDALRAGAIDADAVVPLAYVHDFTRREESVQIDARAVEALAAALEGTD